MKMPAPILSADNTVHAAGELIAFAEPLDFRDGLVHLPQPYYAEGRSISRSNVSATPNPQFSLRTAAIRAGIGLSLDIRLSGRDPTIS